MGIPQIFTLSPLTQDDWEQFGSIHTKKKRTKYLIYKYLVLFLVPRPAFEIIKVGKMWVKRKMRKNAAITLYFNML